MKNILFILSSIILLTAIPVVVFFFGKQTDIRSKAAPATTLAIQPSSTTTAVGDTTTWKVIINTGPNQVASAKISLTFDQTKFEAQSITNAALAPRILNQGTIGIGTATITVAAQSTVNPISGTGEIAVLRLKAINGSSSPTSVQFAQDTFVAGIGEQTVNVLTSTQPGSITVSGGNNVASNTTESPTITQSAISPTSIISISPTTIPSLSPSPSTSQTTQAVDMFAAQPASASALTFSVHTEATRGGKPLIKGMSAPESTITVVFHTSPPQTKVVSASTTGSWQTTPSVALSQGTYTVVVTALNPSTGSTETMSSTFTISGGIGGGSEIVDATGDAIPETGSIEITLILLFTGSVMMVFGIFPLLKKYS